MIDELAAGVFGLGGAVVGGFASWAAARSQMRHQQQQSDAEHARHLEDQRRLTYVAFLSRADILMSLVKEIAGHDAPAQVPEGTITRYHAAWDDFVLSLAGAQIIGPPEVRSAAGELRDASADAANIVDDWLVGGRWSPKVKDDFGRAVETRMRARDRFVDLVGSTLTG